MRILVDATGASKGGMQAYLRGMFSAWHTYFPSDELTVLVTPDVQGMTKDALRRSGKVVHVQSTGQVSRFMAQQLVVPRMARQSEPDVVFCLVPVTPLSLKSVPVVSVAHDFRHLHRPEEFSPLQRAYRGLLYPRSLLHSDLVIANSYRTGEEVEVVTKGRQRNVRVVYMGTEQPDGIVKSSNHAIAFGHWTNKQPEMSVRAWGHLRKLQPDLTTKLFVVGVPIEQLAVLESLASDSGVADLVSIESYIPDKKYLSLFESARLVLMPSTFEGFGMPVIEALAHRIPVVASRGVGLEEAGKDFVWYADPGSPDELAERCLEVLCGGREVEERLQGGQRHASSFTWQRTAMMTRSALEEAVKLHAIKKRSLRK